MTDIVALDIGGTHARFALASIRDETKRAIAAAVKAHEKQAAHGG